MFQQMKKKLKWNKELSSIFLLLKVNPKTIPIFESKFVVMDDMFHMIGSKII
jgi:hypothetical protein